MIKEKPIDLYDSSPPYGLIAGIALISVTIGVVLLIIFNWKTSVYIEELGIDSDLGILDQTSALEDYLRSDVTIPQGKAALAHLKVKNFSEGTYVVHMNPVNYATIDQLQSLVGYNLSQLVNTIPDTYTIESVSALPQYKNISRSDADAFVEEAYLDDAMVHTYYYEPDFSQMISTIDYDQFSLDVYYVEAELVDHFFPSEILDYEHLQIGDSDGIFYIMSDATGTSSPHKYINWYHQEDGFYQYMGISEKDMDLYTKEAFIELAQTIEANYQMKLDQ